MRLHHHARARGLAGPLACLGLLVGAVLLWAGAASAQLEPGPRIKGHKDLDCQQCHISGSGIGSQKCLSCHTHTPLKNRIRAGKGLHATSKIKDKGCEQCHLEHKGRDYDPIDWKPFGGQRRFDHGLTGYDLEGAHKRVDCKECHTATYKKSSHTKYLGLDSDCLTCHEDVHRFGRSQKSLLECKICHSFDARTVSKAEGLSRFDHGKIADFALKGKHNETKCTNCHTSTKSFKLRDRPDQCVDCHEDVHKNVYTIKGRDCAACHRDDKPSFAAKTKWKHGQMTNFPLKIAHKKLKCTECHQKTSKDVPDQSCTKCHTEDSAHVVGGKDRFKGRDCGQCHSDNKKDFDKDVIFNHKAQTGFALKGAHNTGCTTCHRVEHDVKTAKKPEETFEFFPNQTCIGCHTHVNAHNKQFHDRPRLCTKCHVPGSESMKNPPHSELSANFAQQGAHAPIACDKCHGEALKVLNPGNDCASCHKDDDAHKENLGPSCKQCHFEGYPWSDVIFNHNVNSEYKLEGKHAAVACNKCHTSAPQAYKPTPTDCVSCHKDQDVHHAKLGTNCAQCHDMHGTTTQFDHNTMTEYALEGAHARADCVGCHYEGKPQAAKLNLEFTALGTECRDCHGDPHGLRPGAACIGCHDLEDFQNARGQIGAGDGEDPKGGKGKAGKKTSADGKKDDGKVPDPDGGPGEQALFKSPNHASEGPASEKAADVAGGTPDEATEEGGFSFFRAFVNPTYTSSDKRDRYHDVPPFNLRDGHSRVACARCHGGRGDLQGFGKLCDTCHQQDDIHAGSLGPTCADCHSQRAFYPSSFTHTTTAFPLVGSHRMLSCKQCHAAGNYMGLSGACVSCHLDDALRASATKNTEHVGSGYIARGCIQCHNQVSWTLAPFLQRRF